TVRDRDQHEQQRERVEDRDIERPGEGCSQRSRGVCATADQSVAVNREIAHKFKARTEMGGLLDNELNKARVAGERYRTARGSERVTTVNKPACYHKRFRTSVVRSTDSTISIPTDPSAEAGYFQIDREADDRHPFSADRSRRVRGN